QYHVTLFILWQQFDHSTLLIFDCGGPCIHGQILLPLEHRWKVYAQSTAWNNGNTFALNDPEIIWLFKINCYAGIWNLQKGNTQFHEGLSFVVFYLFKFLFQFIQDRINLLRMTCHSSCQQT